MPTIQGLAMIGLALLGGAVAAESPTSIATVAWLQGCWQDANARRTIEEHWMAPLGDSMSGLGRTVRGGRLAEFEAVVIRETASGLTYEARPSGQPPAAFKAVSAGERTIVFEDPAHEFPQRVGYAQPDPSTLTAWIEGTREGKVRRIEFRYRRVPCP